MSNTLYPLSSPHRISVPFITAEFGGVKFGLTDKINSVTGIRSADFITGLNVDKYGSGAVNTYSLDLKYVITPESDPNYVDLVLSKARDREIAFTYGDLTQPEFSYKNEKAIITQVIPNVDYKRNTISYKITATSSTRLSYANKFDFIGTTDQPSSQILKVLYEHPEYGLLKLLPGMVDKDKVLGSKWIPRGDKVVEISEKRNISPIDYILYLVSLMVGSSGEYYYLKVLDSLDGEQLPHFEIISTLGKSKNQMLNISIGYPGSIPVYDFSTKVDSSIALLVDFRDKIEKGIYQDYSFRGDLISKQYYSSQVIEGNPSANLKNWWDKMLKFPITASLTTEGLYIPAEIIQSVYLDVYFFGKKYNTSGEYLILGQKDSISSAGYTTTLDLMRIGASNV